MPRRLRIEYDDAIYHVMARGNARQDIVHDDDDRRRILADLERVVTRLGWLVVSFVLMTNHFLLRTLRPNLARGMQAFLSGYAAWAARHRRRPGHLFQGRYKAEMIEDETYYWTVSRYIHLNPVRAGLVARPEDWQWSSYPGYVRPDRSHPWVAHQALLDAWRGEHGGTDPADAYRRFIEAGLAEPPPSPFREAFGGWALGSGRFVDRLRTLAGTVTAGSRAPEARQLAGLYPGVICATVARYYGLELSSLAQRHDPHIARPVAAWICRRHAEVPLRDLAGQFGLARPDSVPNLTRRLEAKLPKSPGLSEELRQILELLTGGVARAEDSR